MMTFIMLTLSITVAMLLSGLLGFLVMTNARVMKWYMNYIVKMMSRMEQTVDDQENNGL